MGVTLKDCQVVLTDCQTDGERDFEYDWSLSFDDSDDSSDVDDLNDMNDDVEVDVQGKMIENGFDRAVQRTVVLADGDSKDSIDEDHNGLEGEIIEKGLDRAVHGATLLAKDYSHDSNDEVDNDAAVEVNKIRDGLEREVHSPAVIVVKNGEITNRDWNPSQTVAEVVENTNNDQAHSQNPECQTVFDDKDNGPMTIDVSMKVICSDEKPLTSMDSQVISKNSVCTVENDYSEIAEDKSDSICISDVRSMSEDVVKNGSIEESGSDVAESVKSWRRGKMSEDEVSDGKAEETVQNTELVTSVKENNLDFETVLQTKTENSSELDKVAAEFDKEATDQNKTFVPVPVSSPGKDEIVNELSQHPEENGDWPDDDVLFDNVDWCVEQEIEVSTVQDSGIVLQECLNKVEEQIRLEHLHETVPITEENVSMVSSTTPDLVSDDDANDDDCFNDDYDGHCLDDNDYDVWQEAEFSAIQRTDVVHDSSVKAEKSISDENCIKGNVLVTMDNSRDDIKDNVSAMTDNCRHESVLVKMDNSKDGIKDNVSAMMDNNKDSIKDNVLVKMDNNRDSQQEECCSWSDKDIVYDNAGWNVELEVEVTTMHDSSVVLQECLDKVEENVQCSPDHAVAVMYSPKRNLVQGFEILEDGSCRNGANSDGVKFAVHQKNPGTDDNLEGLCNSLVEERSIVKDEDQILITEVKSMKSNENSTNFDGADSLHDETLNKGLLSKADGSVKKLELTSRDDFWRDESADWSVENEIEANQTFYSDLMAEETSELRNSSQNDNEHKIGDLSCDSIKVISEPVELVEDVHMSAIESRLQTASEMTDFGQKERVGWTDKLIHDKQPERLDHDKQPKQLAHARQPEQIVHHKQPERLDHDKQPEQLAHARQPERIVHDKQPERLDHDKQPEQLAHARQPERTVAQPNYFGILKRKPLHEINSPCKKAKQSTSDSDVLSWKKEYTISSKRHDVHSEIIEEKSAVENFQRESVIVKTEIVTPQKKNIIPFINDEPTVENPPIDNSKKPRNCLLSSPFLNALSRMKSGNRKVVIPFINDEPDPADKTDESDLGLNPVSVGDQKLTSPRPDIIHFVKTEVVEVEELPNRIGGAEKSSPLKLSSEALSRIASIGKNFSESRYALPKTSPDAKTEDEAPSDLTPWRQEKLVIEQTSVVSETKTTEPLVLYLNSETNSYRTNLSDASQWRSKKLEFNSPEKGSSLITLASCSRQLFPETSCLFPAKNDFQDPSKNKDPQPKVIPISTETSINDDFSDPYKNTAAQIKIVPVSAGTSTNRDSSDPYKNKDYRSEVIPISTTTFLPSKKLSNFVSASTKAESPSNIVKVSPLKKTVPPIFSVTSLSQISPLKNSESQILSDVSSQTLPESQSSLEEGEIKDGIKISDETIQENSKSSFNKLTKLKQSPSLEEGEIKDDIKISDEVIQENSKSSFNKLTKLKQSPLTKYLSPGEKTSSKVLTSTPVISTQTRSQNLNSSTNSANVSSKYRFILPKQRNPLEIINFHLKQASNTSSPVTPDPHLSTSSKSAYFTPKNSLIDDPNISQSQISKYYTPSISFNASSASEQNLSVQYAKKNDSKSIKNYRLNPAQLSRNYSANKNVSKTSNKRPLSPEPSSRDTLSDVSRISGKSRISSEQILSRKDVSTISGNRRLSSEQSLSSKDVTRIPRNRRLSSEHNLSHKDVSRISGNRPLSSEKSLSRKDVSDNRCLISDQELSSNLTSKDTRSKKCVSRNLFPEISRRKSISQPTTSKSLLLNSGTLQPSISTPISKSPASPSDSRLQPTNSTATLSKSPASTFKPWLQPATSKSPRPLFNSRTLQPSISSPTSKSPTSTHKSKSPSTTSTSKSPSRILNSRVQFTISNSRTSASNSRLQPTKSTATSSKSPIFTCTSVSQFTTSNSPTSTGKTGSQPTISTPTSKRPGPFNSNSQLANSTATSLKSPVSTCKSSQPAPTQGNFFIRDNSKSQPSNFTAASSKSPASTCKSGSQSATTPDNSSASPASKSNSGSQPATTPGKSSVSPASKGNSSSQPATTPGKSSSTPASNSNSGSQPATTPGKSSSTPASNSNSGSQPATTPGKSSTIPAQKRSTSFFANSTLYPSERSLFHMFGNTSGLKRNLSQNTKSKKPKVFVDLVSDDSGDDEIQLVGSTLVNPPTVLDLITID